ncbi:beta-galactosidase [Streptomyces sp. NPDC005408]|uniref:beta-galactosidase n=1 Tax=Streptomyces sp. NPDC005408 TaxID=3155341 RepID=UPI0033AD5896
MSTGRSLTLIGALAAVVLVLVSLAVLRPDDRKPYYFGTLQTNPAMARTEHEHGIRVAHLTIHWDRFEPAEGQYDAAYIDSVKADLRALREAGALVEVGFGLNHPPGWLYEAHPDAAFVDQHGDRYTGTPNMVFSRAVRAEADQYIGKVAEAIDLGDVWAIRVGVNSSGEFSYPAPVSEGDGGDYWAYDANAQGQDSAPGRPATVPASPFPGWRPGERTYNGSPFTASQVSRWYDWYLAALADTVNWQIGQYRSLGYDGLLKVLIPGAGFYPDDHARAIANHLDGSVAAQLVSRGTAYFRTLQQVGPRRNVQMVSTALVDGSGMPRNNGCAAEDATVDVRNRDSAEARRWSSVRWVAAIAERDGFALGGESAGPQVAPYYEGVMDDAAHQMKSCGLKGLMWAFDSQLYDGTPGSSLQDYAKVIDRYS